MEAGQMDGSRQVVDYLTRQDCLILNWTELGSELGEAGDMDEMEDGG